MQISKLFSKLMFSVFGLVLFSVFFLGGNLYSQTWLEEASKNQDANFFDAKKAFNKFWESNEPKKAMGWKQFKRKEFFWEQRLYPTGEYPNPREIFKQYQSIIEKQKKNESMLELPEWTSLGPDADPAKSKWAPPAGVGRLSCVTINPNNANQIWVGAAFGGIWRSNDRGNSWHTFPFTEFMSIGISDIALAPSNTNIIYAATGDADGSGVLGSKNNFSSGIIKSTNGGADWEMTASFYQSGMQLSYGVLINRILVHPKNPDIVFAASNAGLLASNNGGQSWGALVQRPVRDIEFKPNDPTIIYAAFYGNNYAYTIEKINTSGQTLASTNVFNDVLRIELTTVPGAPDKVFALLAKKDQTSIGSFHSVMVSNTAAESWNVVAEHTSHPNYLDFNYDGSLERGQGLYDLAIAVNPENTNEIYIGGINVWKSVDGGANWNCVAEWTGAYGIPQSHADCHALVFDQNGVLYSANDGGLDWTNNGGASWKTINNGLNITQFYRLKSHPNNEAILLAGSQDNGTHKMQSASWSNIWGGDGMECAIDKNNNDNVYISVNEGKFFKSTDGGNFFNEMLNRQLVGESANWVAPMVLAPDDPETIYCGYENIYVTKNKGSNWSRFSNINSNGLTLIDIAVSPSNPKVIYGAYYPAIIRTTDGGAQWDIIYQTEDAWVADIAIDPKQPGHIWATFSGYNQGLKVLEFQGDKIINISSGLPNVPVSCVVCTNPNTYEIFVGTDIGVFGRSASKPEWVYYNNGLPNVVVSDIEFLNKSKKLRVATYGRGIWEMPVIDCNIEKPEIQMQGETTICEGEKKKLTVAQNYYKYKWQPNGETTKSIDVTESGSYYCEVEDNKGCQAITDAVNIYAVEVPEFEIKISGGKAEFCEGDSLRLNVGSFDYNKFEWSTGETTRSIYVKQPGEYSVKGFTSTGCEFVPEAVTVDMLDAPDKPTVQKEGNTLTASAADSYQWYLDGSEIDGANAQTYECKVSGMYSVEVFNAAGCAKISDETQVIIDGVEEFSENSHISLMPNPTDGVFTFQLSGPQIGKFELSVSDLSGKTILSFNEQKQNGFFSKEINLQRLATGIYLVKCNFNGKVFSKKLIKK